MSGNTYDRIRIRPPVCYLPPMWEIVISRDIGEIGKLAGGLAATVPDTSPAAIERHLNERIRIVEKLKESRKLDGKIADAAISHFRTHLEELKALQM